MSYCERLSTQQVINVLLTEKDRMERYEAEEATDSDHYKEAVRLHRDAREVLFARNVNPDEV